MQELAIKIRIYDRQYPMKVQPKDEAYVRKAAEHINHQIKAYSDQFNKIDIQDLLAMIAFDCLVDNLRIKKGVADSQDIIEKKLHNLFTFLEDIT